MSNGLALVTGATGFIGSHVVRALLSSGYEVRALVRPSSRKDNLAGVECEVAIGDILDRASVASAARGCRFLFHAAAEYRLWSRDPKALYRTNVDGTVNMLHAAADAAVERVVYTSTVGALGIPRDGSPGTEDTPVGLADMVGHYKRSKYLAEERVRSYVAETGRQVVIVNPSTPVGERDIKPTPTGKIIADFLNHRMPAYVDTGLNLVDVRDVAVGHVLAAERGTPGRRYILGNANMTLREVLTTLAEITGLPAPRIRLPYFVAYSFAVWDTFVSGTLLGREPRAPIEGVKMAAKHMYFDSSRAINELGLPQSPIRDALARAVRWFVEHGYGPEPPALRAGGRSAT